MFPRLWWVVCEDSGAETMIKWDWGDLAPLERQVNSWFSIKRKKKVDVFGVSMSNNVVSADVENSRYSI